jgi:hypothetical protein
VKEKKMPRYYFIRANGETAHSDPKNSNCLVKNEPPGYFNYLWDLNRYCFRKNIIRIGWPDVGEITSAMRSPNGKGTGALASCYNWRNANQKYLMGFSQIPVGSIILVPDRPHAGYNGIAGDIYIAETVGVYYYHHNVPIDPYECAHRINVEWDRDKIGNPELYTAAQLSISIYGGFWVRAFYEILNGQNDAYIIANIQRERTARGHP